MNHFCEQSMEVKTDHIPVLSKEVLESLKLKPGAVIVDCTFGLGGHAKLIAQEVAPSGRIIGIDRDEESLSLSREQLSAFGCGVDLFHNDFRNIRKILEKLSIPGVDGFLFDLGLSSFQLDNPARGFSFNSDGPLDMRLDQESQISAYDLVNSLSERELSSIIKNFGQERWHNRIAHSLVTQRSKHPIESTQELKEIILRSIPLSYHRQKIHPATRTFQAIRIAVNRELEALAATLSEVMDYLKIGGRVCVISFHSLEDKIVKEKFRSFAKEKRIQMITKKPLRPTQEEIVVNSRCRSARLRVAEKI